MTGRASRLAPGAVALCCLRFAPPCWAGASNPETPAIDVQAFRPSPDATTTLWTEDTHVGQPGITFRTLVSWMNDPLVYTYDDGRTVGLVTDVAQVDLLPCVHFWRARVGLDLPLYPAVYTREQRAVFGFGDLRLNGRLVVLDADVAPVGVGLEGGLGLPTGTTDGLRAGGVSGDALLIVERVEGHARFSANGGVRLAPERHFEGLVVHDVFTARLAASYALSLVTGLDIEGVGSAPFGVPLTTPGGTSAEWMAGAWYRHQSLVIRGGVGTGLTRGIGSPDVRAVVGFGWERVDGPGDRDRDGVPNRVDRCPRDPEDDDSFADDDGCADPDNDHDHVRDRDDRCPDDAATPPDRREGDDRCPEPDNRHYSPIPLETP